MTRVKHLSLLQPKRLAAGLWLAGALLLVAPLRPTSAHAAPRADSVVTNCTQQGLADAMNFGGNGLITFNCGQAPVTIAITQPGGLNALSGDAFTIDGGNLVTLSGGDTTRLFWVHSGAALTLTNLTLSHGNAASGTGLDLQGGAILNDGGALVLNNAIVRDSQSTFAAGAIENASGTATLVDSLIENNQSDYGGGIDSIGTLTLINTTVRSNQALTDTGGGLDISGTVVIDNSLIVSNSANTSAGGGIYSLGALTVTRSSLSYNSATGGGGLVNYGPATLTDVTLSGNSAASDDGGGIYNDGILALTNVTLSGNLAGGQGGGISNHSPATLSNVTLSGNSAGGDGGGVYNLGKMIVYNATIVFNHSDPQNNGTGSGGGVFIYPGKVFELHNSLVAGNMQGNGTNDCVGTLRMYGQNLLYVILGCTLQDQPGGSWSFLSDLASIGPLQNNGGPTLTRMPRLGSQMIDGGDPAAGCTGPDGTLLFLDQRGQPRIDNNSSFDCDIGAVERQPADVDHRLYLPLVVR